MANTIDKNLWRTVKSIKITTMIRMWKKQRLILLHNADIKSWMNNNWFEINTTKCKFISFSLRKQLHKCSRASVIVVGGVKKN